MDSTSPVAPTIDAYIAQFPHEVATMLQEIRKVCHEVVPEGKEAIKYAMPTIVHKGNLVCFAGYKKHVAVYPVTVGMRKALPDLAPFTSGQATLKFPLTSPLPLALIKKAIAKRLQEVEQGE